MLTEYLQLIKVWLKIQKDFNTLVEDIHLDVGPCLERRGMDPTDAVDQCWEATRAKFKAHEELATIAQLHERQKLLSRKMQEEIWYDKWVTEQEALHEATIDNIKEDLENLAREKVEANKIQRGHKCNVRYLSARSCFPDSKDSPQTPKLKTQQVNNVAAKEKSAVTPTPPPKCILFRVSGAMFEKGRAHGRQPVGLKPGARPPLFWKIGGARCTPKGKAPLGRAPTPGACNPNPVEMSVGH
ncbi:hypothetical protein PCASD_06533 [Puccinia coronata f. sp. avenae]|uniref:Uncharacterized protein n=1 Tax=Puccinia coronata f. sp. avenae TaxID=200324 RepID=A0A2N5TFQ0_9BASI|nr:hypothetical protein PCASD_06533 [Puccinia coronata f. sp. avenae]